MEVSGIHEVLVDPNASSQMESLAQSVSSLSGIPVERLAFTEVRVPACFDFHAFFYTRHSGWQLLGKVAVCSESPCNVGRQCEVLAAAVLRTERCH